MKKIIKNPKALIFLTIVLILIYEIPYQFNGWRYIFKGGSDFVTYFKYIFFWSKLIPLIYFTLLISKVKVKLNIMNFILLFYYIINLVEVYINYNFFNLTFSSLKNMLSYIMLGELPSFITLIIFLIIIFYSRKSKNYNLICSICLAFYFIHFLYAIKLFPDIKTISSFLNNLYFVPMLLYFRLYASNKFKERR